MPARRNNFQNKTAWRQSKFVWQSVMCCVEWQQSVDKCLSVIINIIINTIVVDILIIIVIFTKNVNTMVFLSKTSPSFITLILYTRTPILPTLHF